MSPTTIGIETTSLRELQAFIGQLTSDRDELRRELTATLERARAVRAVILSMAARWDESRDDLLHLADLLTGTMSSTNPDGEQRSPAKSTPAQQEEPAARDRANLRQPDRGATSTAPRSGLTLSTTARKGKE